MANPSLVRKNTQWLSGTTYTVGDVVWVSSNNIQYPITCLVTHVAGTFATDVSSNYWQMSVPMKNYIINGNFRIAQRGTVNDAIDARYTRDRWFGQTGIGGATNTFTQQSTGLAGTLSEFCQRITKTDTGTGTGNTYNFQAIETVNARSIVGKTVTLSCRARTNNSTNIRLFLQGTSSTSTDASPSSGTNIASSFFNLTSSFALYSITFTVPSNALTVMGIVAQNVNVAVNNQNNYIEITDVMLNEGPVPAAFNLFAADPVNELATCKRYYETGSHGTSDTGNASGVLGGFGVCRFSVEKRAAPTVTMFNGGTPNQARNNNTGASEGTLAVGSVGTTFVQIRSTTGLTDNVDYTFGFTADAEL